MEHGVQCKDCGSTNIDSDSGNVVCCDCGHVIEDANIVSDVEYIRDGKDRGKAVGRIVTLEGAVIGRGGPGRESKEITLSNAKQNITNLANKLQLKPYAIEQALGYYKLALAKHLTKGRKNSHVVAACVYMVCRKDGTSHMLLDLSEALQVNVYELGKTFLKLSSTLRINTPVVDPIIYIERFSHQLNFGNKENEVKNTAIKLVRRMKSDWIQFGRRPSGLCGAALLVAARLHNFNIKIEEIIKVVKVCQATVRKRLIEFSDTPSGKLSIDDFLTVNLSEEQDPPSFKNARKKMHELEDESKAKELENQVTEIRKQIEKALESTTKKRGLGYSEIDASSEASTSNMGILVAENTALSIQGLFHGSKDSREVGNLAPALLEAEKGIVFESQGHSFTEGCSNGLHPTMDSLGVRKGIGSSSAPTTAEGKESGEELDLTGIDIDELDMYLMKPEEFKRKEECWLRYNSDYLEELKEKERKRALEEEENAKKPPKKKRVCKSRTQIQASTTGEAMSKVFQQKKISHKLNYDILKTLNPAEPMIDLVEPQSDSKADVETQSVKSVRSRSKAKPKINPVPLNIKNKMLAIIGNKRQREQAPPPPLPPSEEETSSQAPPSLRISGGVIEPVNEEVAGPSVVEEVVNETEGIDEVADSDVDSEEEYGYYQEEMPPDFDEYNEYIEPYDD